LAVGAFMVLRILLTPLVLFELEFDELYIILLFELEFDEFLLFELEFDEFLLFELEFDEFLLFALEFILTIHQDYLSNHPF
jgi:hypothetical protein